MQPDRLGMGGKGGGGYAEVDSEELNRTPQGTPVVAKATQRDGHVAGPSPEQPGETPVLL